MTRPTTFRIPPGTRFRRHAHEGPHLCGVLEGGFVEAGPKVRHDVGAGVVRVTPAARHDLDFGPAGARCVVLSLPTMPFARLERWVFLPGDRYLGGLLTLLADGTDPDAIEDLETEVAAQVLRRLDARKAGAPPPWLTAVRERIADGEPSDVATLAAAAGVHRVSLARAFRDHYGVPVSAYRRRVQLRRARDLIREGRWPLGRIAAETGFADQSHLTRAFRGAYGRPPASWRRHVTGVQDESRRPA